MKKSKVKIIKNFMKSKSENIMNYANEIYKIERRKYYELYEWNL